MKKTILINLLFFSALMANAQNSDSLKISKFNHSIGLHAGYSSAYGLSGGDIESMILYSSINKIVKCKF